MSKKISDIVQGFKDGKCYRSLNLYVENPGLYSYGSHFTLALSRDPASNLKTKEKWYLLNGDKYSVTTSKHQVATFRVFKEYPRVAFSAIQAAGLDPRDCLLVDFWPDDSDYWNGGEQSLDNFKQSLDTFKNTMPLGASYSEHKDVNTGEVIRANWHQVGSCVLRHKDTFGVEYNKPKYTDYLCSMDENSYFVSKLPRLVKSVEQAFSVLKPKVVKQAEGWGYDVKRQGEWFFVPVDLPCPKSRFISGFELPRANDSSNRHIVTRGIYVYNKRSHKKDIFCYGIVRHKLPTLNKRSGEHRPLVLYGENKKVVFYKAVKNTSRGDWSASGRVD